MVETQAQLLQLISKIPYPGQICDIDLTSSADAIYFTWRNDRFKVSFPLIRVDQAENGILSGSNVAILLDALLKGN